MAFFLQIIQVIFFQIIQLTLPKFSRSDTALDNGDSALSTSSYPILCSIIKMLIVNICLDLEHAVGSQGMDTNRLNLGHVNSHIILKKVCKCISIRRFVWKYVQITEINTNCPLSFKEIASNSNPKQHFHNLFWWFQRSSSIFHICCT